VIDDDRLWEYLTLAVICVCSLRPAADHRKGAENMNGEEKIRNQKLWYARIEEMLSSDISQKQWCQNNGINSNSMYYWLRSKDHAKIKALKWDADGFVLYYKRRERGTFQWPKNFRNDDTDQIPRSDLNRLLSGLIMESYIKRRHFLTV
jgi:hypothetical protein